MSCTDARISYSWHPAGLWRRQEKIDRSGPFSSARFSPWPGYGVANSEKLALLGPTLAAPKLREPVFTIDDQRPT
jgi:hypothetical protein